MSSKFADAAVAHFILDEIKRGGYSHVPTVISLLKQIIEDHPGTLAEGEAQELLECYLKMPLTHL